MLHDMHIFLTWFPSNYILNRNWETPMPMYSVAEDKWYIAALSYNKNYVSHSKTCTLVCLKQIYNVNMCHPFHQAYRIISKQLSTIIYKHNHNSNYDNILITRVVSNSMWKLSLWSWPTYNFNPLPLHGFHTDERAGNYRQCASCLIYSAVVI